MKKLAIFLIMCMLLVSGCSKQNENTALEKGDIPLEKLVLLDGGITSGWAAWNRFYSETTGAKLSDKTTVESMIEIEYNYSSDEESGQAAEQYEVELRYEDEKYVYKNLTEGIYETYEYLIEVSGTPSGTDKLIKGYYLVNDNTLTFENIEKSMISSQSTDHIDMVMIYTEEF